MTQATATRRPALHIEFDTRSYVRSHGREPRGTGSWAFEFNDEAATHWVPGSRTYTEAKKYIKALVLANAAEHLEAAIITILP